MKNLFGCGGRFVKGVVRDWGQGGKNRGKRCIFLGFEGSGGG